GPSVSEATPEQGAGGLSEAGSQERSGTHARRADFPGAGDAARRRRRRIHARRKRPAAALDGRMEAQGRPRAPRKALARRHARQWLRRSIRQADLSADSRLRRVRLSRIARGELRAAGLRIVVAQMLRARRVHLRTAEFAADGILFAVATDAG